MFFTSQVGKVLKDLAIVDIVWLVVFSITGIDKSFVKWTLVEDSKLL